MRPIALLATLIALPAAAQEPTGILVQDARTVEPFHGIAVNSAADVSVTVGPAQSVMVLADEAAAEHVTTEVIDDVLTVGIGSIEGSVGAVSIQVTTPMLDRARLAGAGDLTITDVRADRFDASLAGSGDLVVTGDAQLVSARSVGSGRIDLSGVQAAQGQVDLIGSGEIHVNVRDTLGANLAGSGDILYLGTPEVLSSVAGTGRIQRGELAPAE